jgi:hypothetical protein
MAHRRIEEELLQEMDRLFRRPAIVLKRRRGTEYDVLILEASMFSGTTASEM